MSPQELVSFVCLCQDAFHYLELHLGSSWPPSLLFLHRIWVMLLMSLKSKVSQLLFITPFPLCLYVIFPVLPFKVNKLFIFFKMIHLSLYNAHLSLVTIFVLFFSFFVLKSILSYISVVTPAFFSFLLPCAWWTFFHPLIFSLNAFLGLRWVSCRQHIDGTSLLSTSPPYFCWLEHVSYLHLK